jgi:hypothetical protein
MYTIVQYVTFHWRCVLFIKFTCGLSIQFYV